MDFIKIMTVLKSRNLFLFYLYCKATMFGTFQMFYFQKPLFSLMLILVELAAAANNFVI